MQIIDFERKGNVVRFYLGENGEQYGYDWDDTPYECNAGTVYDRFVKFTVDISFPFDDLVLEPSSGTFSSDFCKLDMVKRKVPCIIVVPHELYESDFFISNDFSRWVCNDGVKKYYFGDEVTEHD